MGSVDGETSREGGIGGVAWVYCLATAEEPIQTYVGATVDLERRLRQHNGELKGGARRTGARPGGWYRVCAVGGFETWQQALQFEWRWKWFSRKEKKGGALEKRRDGLEKTIEWWQERYSNSLQVEEGS